MNGHRRLLPVTFALASLASVPSAMAQSDPMRLAHLMSANQIGAMEYCMSKGWADQAAVDAQKSAAAKLPAPTDQAGLSEAEATGRKGEMMNNGSTISLSSMAQKGNTSEQDLCTRMVSSAKMVAAQQSSMPAMPGMPAGTAMPSMPSGMTTPSMPSGMTMPSMPSGMTMPSMPPGMTMPSMPGVPKP